MQPEKSKILEYLKNNKSNFKDNYNIEKFGLFGSFARNEQTANSDVDIV